MPEYAWTRRVCETAAPAGAEACPARGAPAEIPAVQIERLRRRRDGLPPRPVIAPRRLGWIFVAFLLGRGIARLRGGR